MPDISYTLDDGFGTVGKKMKLRWRPTSPQGVSGAVIVAPGAPQWVSSVVGTPTTVTGIAATRWEIDNLGHINNHQPIYIDVPAEGGDVTALIRAAIGVPPEAPVSTLVAAAKDAAEIAVAEFDFAPAFPTTGITYDGNQNVQTVTTDGIVTTYTYNPDGTVATDTRLGVTRTYGYDGNGNLTSITVED